MDGMKQSYFPGRPRLENAVIKRLGRDICINAALKWRSTSNVTNQPHKER